MADLFLELFSEEIPARLQSTAEENLKKIVKGELQKVESKFEVMKSFSTPRRLILVIQGLSEKTSPEAEEKRGPSVLAPKVAIDGFCKSMAISQSQLFVKEEKKGEFYYVKLEKAGQLNVDIIPGILSRVINGFPWPKSMRWGSGNFKWVRPLRSMICVLYSDTDSKVLPLEFNGVKSSNVSEGHRFLSPEKFSISSFEDYYDKMRYRYVILDRSVRKEKIWHEASNAAFAIGRELVQDDDLLEEVTGLVEWPVILVGKINKNFLKLPSEVLKVSMREHQKFFSLRNKKTDIIDAFIAVSNLDAEDNGKNITHGNERVLTARLSDAKFFWENDVRRIKRDGYKSFAKKLTKVIFHNRLGSEADRIKRITNIAKNIAQIIGADLKSTEVAASLCKLDLVSEIVYEFPELQGIIGRYYAKRDGFDESIADACYEHYLPRGPFDDVPRKPISVTLALAEKIDLISNFWSIDLKPTGSKDPFALRRAAIGIIRILLENELDLTLISILRLGNTNLDFEGLINFFNDRLRIQFGEKALNTGIIDSLNLKLYQNISLNVMLLRLFAIRDFVDTEAGSDLIQGYKRAVNILTVEESREGVKYSLDPKIELFKEDLELKLYQQLQKIGKKIIVDLEEEKPEAALRNLSSLRGPIDDFFDVVKINSENPIIRKNRLCLLNQIKEVMHQVADFSKIG